MYKVCVLIRVYNRIEDLKYCIKIIRDTWKLNDYYVLVIANGTNDGYIIDEETKGKIDKLIEIENNIGHYNGNSQLLLEGLKHIPDSCDYTLLLEADTWTYGDELVSTYIGKLQEEGAVWASAQWYNYFLTLATDYVITKTQFIKNEPKVLTFVGPPEYYVARFLKDNNYRFIYIKENMPINLPRYVKKYPFAPTGRFFSFPESKMVTHHVEVVNGGMERKKYDFNVVANTNYFDLSYPKSYSLQHLKLKTAIMLSYLFPYKSWIIKSKDIKIINKPF